MKNSLVERFQQLAGINTLLVEFEDGQPQNDQEKAQQLLHNAQEALQSILTVANKWYRDWTNEGIAPGGGNDQEGEKIVNDSSWQEVSTTLSGEALFLYFVYWASRNKNVIHADFGEDGDVNRFLDDYIEQLAELDVNYQLFPGDLGKIMGAFGQEGDMQDDRERLLKWTLTTGLTGSHQLYLDQEELFDAMKGGTLQSSSWMGAGKLGFDRKSGQYTRGREASFSPEVAKKLEKEMGTIVDPDLGITRPKKISDLTPQELKALLDKGSKTSIKLQEAKEYIKQLLKKLKK